MITEYRLCGVLFPDDAQDAHDALLPHAAQVDWDQSLHGVPYAGDAPALYDARHVGVVLVHPVYPMNQIGCQYFVTGPDFYFP